MYRILAVLVIAVSALLGPVSPASASAVGSDAASAAAVGSDAASAAAVGSDAASAAAIQCWNEIDTYKSGQTVYAYAIKDCVHFDVPQGLSLTLEMNICDQFGCMWVPWVSGVGTVSYKCPGTFYAELRSSRLRSKIVYCTYY